jgi:hypothetical protein
MSSGAMISPASTLAEASSRETSTVSRGFRGKDAMILNASAAVIDVRKSTGTYHPKP